MRDRGLSAEMQAELPTMKKSSSEEGGNVDLCGRRSFRELFGTLERPDVEEMLSEIKGQYRNNGKVRAGHM